MKKMKMEIIYYSNNNVIVNDLITEESIVEAKELEIN